MNRRLSGLLARGAGVRLFRFFSRPLAGDPAPPPQGVVMAALSAVEVADLSADGTLDLDRGRVAEAYARGDFCVAALAGGEVLGYCWFAFAPLPHLDGVWADFAPEAVWTYKSLVRPQHRGRGLAAALYRFGDAAAAERRRALSIVCVESHNAASVAAALRAGYVPAGHAAWQRRAGRVRAWYSPAARLHGVRFFLP